MWSGLWTTLIWSCMVTTPAPVLMKCILSIFTPLSSSTWKDRKSILLEDTLNTGVMPVREGSMSQEKAATTKKARKRRAICSGPTISKARTGLHSLSPQNSRAFRQALWAVSLRMGRCYAVGGMGSSILSNSTKAKFPFPNITKI